MMRGTSTAQTQANADAHEQMQETRNYTPARKDHIHCSENSRRLWWSQRRKCRSISEGVADFPATTQWALRDILMSRGKNCPETIFVSQLPRNYPHSRGNFERGKNALTVWGRDSLGGILGDDLGEDNCEFKNCLETVGRQNLPRDIKMSRRALWAFPCWKVPNPWQG